jgi:hypothetical protein
MVNQGLHSCSTGVDELTGAAVPMGQPAVGWAHTGLDSASPADVVGGQAAEMKTAAWANRSGGPAADPVTKTVRVSSTSGLLR